MSQEEVVSAYIESANAHLANAEKAAAENNTECAVSEIKSAVDDLTAAGYSILNEIPKEDIVRLDGTVAKFLRRLAEDADLLPKNFEQIINAIPNADKIFKDKLQQPSDESLSAEKIVETVKTVYENEAEAESSDEDFSILKIIKDLLLGNKKITDTVFSENGVYDIFVNTASPYLVTGAAFISRDEDKFAEYEEKIPEILNGPMRHLSKLLLSLLTSAFISGLLLIVIRRILSGKKSVLKNAEFGVDAVKLTVANLPMLIEGTRAAAIEISELKKIVFGNN
ncbi:MAG: hypothetical protein Q4Q53_03750 [Methanocorpusculum sp.]|nr:hypothetical protein [Methanocorpusculum sp.]